MASSKPIKRGYSLIRETYRHDKEREDGYYEQMKRDYLESEENLESFNRRINEANERLEIQITK